MPGALGWGSCMLAGLFAAGCVGSTVPAPGAHSFGLPGRGILRAPDSLARSGPGFVAARPDGQEHWGTPVLVGALQRALASVAERFPGTPPLRVGDLSARSGGRLQHHASHRSGRDADLVFYALDARGQPAQGRGWLAYDRFGIARAPAGPDAPAADGSPIFFFDAARNWQLVRALLADPDVLVQWIFCSHGVKSVLLRYAIEHEPDPAILLQAATVLHQPSNGRPHDDHFHVRVLCPAQDRAGGCAENGPIWPWLRDRVEKLEGADPEVYDDATLIGWLMSEPAPEQVAAGTT